MQDYLKIIRQAVEDNSFIKLSLGNYGGGEEGLKKIIVRPVIIKREENLSFTYSYKTRDIVKNFPVDAAIREIAARIESGFKSSTLFTTGFDLSYPAMKKSKPTSKAPLEKQHDRPKNRMVETLGKKYLHALKITDDRGNVLKNAQDKYRQIDKYVEILSGLVKNAPLEKLKNIADMGAGKGYLTFALADYLKEKGIGAKITGVEYREDLVNLCNQISAESGFENLSFVQGTIENYDASGVNLLIALHACDTATDDAIAKGIQAGAEWIVVAPCCHKQVRREMEKNNIHGDFSFLTRHGIFLERQAEMATDGIRALVLEYFGYRVKVFEFISDSHTPKNVMIVAAKNPKAVLKSDVVLQKIASAKNCLGIGRHYLEKIL